ncbi:MAG TPA: cupin domain-containing protein [Gemmatimonadales bacterium]
MIDRVSALIGELGLEAHPEGGFYGEVYRSASSVTPQDGRGTRPAVTTIYFLLPGGSISRWHRVLSDEVWHHYEGAPLDLWIAGPAGLPIQRLRLGPLQSSGRPVVTVPAGYWQAARSSGEYTLVGCTVAPGFDFRDFTLAADHPDAPAGLRAAAEYVELW